MIVQTIELTRTYRLGSSPVTAVKKVNLEIEESAFVSIVGPSGSGKTNLKYVNSVYISSQYGGSDQRPSLPLSRPYSYLEFDASFVDMEAKFKVFPNGTVDMAGMQNSTRLPYPSKGLVKASFNASTTGNLVTVSSSGKLKFPSDMASQWPYNASTASLVAKYSKQVGNLNLDLNSSSILPSQLPYPYQYWGYPFNSSDFSLSLNYSNGLLNGELDASSVLPQWIASQFPFNATDFSAEADYSGGVFKGNVTFHIVPGFPLSDLILNFRSNTTVLTATGDLNVIFRTYPAYPKPIEVNQTLVNQLIANITALEGQGPNSLFNKTGGSIEFDPASTITQSSLVNPSGTKVTFNLIFKGDLIGTTAFILSGGRKDSLTYPGVYRLVNATVSSVNSASLQLSYAQVTKSISLKLLFEANIETLLANLFTFPPDTKPFVFASGSMYPTLQVGDIVLVKNITSPFEITAVPYTGDIIAFYRPSGPSDVIIHRAINKTLVNTVWYFQTKGDSNYSPDYWSGPDTYNGWISQKLVFGKIVDRIPLIGYLFLLSRTYAGDSAQTLPHDYVTLSKDFLSLIKTFTLKLVYTYVTRKATLQLNIVFNVQGFMDKIVPKLPELVNGNQSEFITKLFSNIYANITLADVSSTYQNGQADYQATVVIQGDFTKEINYIKNLYINEIIKYMPPYVNQAQYLLINQTWLDISNVKANYMMNESTEYFSFDGFRASPPIDPINATSFKLYRFFNLTAPTSPYYNESPSRGERLKLTVQGGGNGTKIVTLFRPPNMPAPDFVSDDHTLMVWNNQTISSLKNLIFSLQYYTGVVVNGQTYPVITASNGTVSPITFDQQHKQLSLTISGATGTVGFANISIPKALLNAPPDGWIIVINGKMIAYPKYQIVETVTQTFLYFTFTFSSPVNIQITGAEAVPEFPTFVTLSLFMAFTMFAIIYLKRKDPRRLKL